MSEIETVEGVRAMERIIRDKDSCLQLVRQLAERAEITRNLPIYHQELVGALCVAVVDLSDRVVELESENIRLTAKSRNSNKEQVK